MRVPGVPPSLDLPMWVHHLHAFFLLLQHSHQHFIRVHFSSIPTTQSKSTILQSQVPFLRDINNGRRFDEDAEGLLLENRNRIETIWSFGYYSASNPTPVNGSSHALTHTLSMYCAYLECNTFNVVCIVNGPGNSLTAAMACWLPFPLQLFIFWTGGYFWMKKPQIYSTYVLLKGVRYCKSMEKTYFRQGRIQTFLNCC